MSTINNTGSITMHFSGATVADVLTQISALLGRTEERSPLAAIKTPDLLSELRDRLAKDGQVVKVLPFAEGGDAGETSQPEQPKTRRTRGPNKNAETPAGDATKPAEQTTATDTATNQPPADAVTEQPKQEAAPETKTVEEPTSEKPVLTIDDVKVALNAHAGVHGQVSARNIMQEVGGAMRLMDIPAAKFQELTEKLLAKTANTTAA